MLTPPQDLTNADLRAALRAGWAFDAVSVEYQAVGFGSHHWLATAADGSRVFATVDDLMAKVRTAQDSTDAAFDRLRTAFRTAYSLREQAGLSFVVAPLADAQGRVLRRLRDRYSLVVHPFVPNREAAVRADGYWRVIVGLLVELHAASCGAARTDDFVVPGRDRLVQMLDEVAFLVSGSDRRRDRPPGAVALPALVRPGRDQWVSRPVSCSARRHCGRRAVVAQPRAFPAASGTVARAGRLGPAAHGP